MDLTEEKRLPLSTFHVSGDVKFFASDPLAPSEQKVASLTNVPERSPAELDSDISAKQTKNCCRICLDNNGVGFNDLFSHFEGERLADTLTYCTSLKVEHEDFLPSLICNSCFEKLKIAKQLRKTTLISDKILRDKLQEIFIKQEIVDESTEPIKEEDNEPSFNFEAVSPEHLEPLIDDPPLNYFEKEEFESDSSEEFKRDAEYIPKIKPREERRKSKNAVKSWSCSFCREDFKCNKLFLSHIREHKLAKVKAPYQCTNCGRGYFLETILRSHKCSSQTRCKICNKGFEKWQALRLHLKADHLDDRKCEKCNIELKSAKHLHHHIRDHDKLNFSCEICGKLFLKNGILLSHLRTAHQQKNFYDCDLCGSSIKNRSSLLRHMQSVHLNLQCVCALCGTTFKSNDNLNLHMIRHHGAPAPVTCPKCNKKFLFVSQLNIHDKQVHLKIPLYPNNATLQKPRNFKCHLCEKTFRNNPNLIKHIQLHKNGHKFQKETFNFKCEFCDKLFRTGQEIADHRRTHTKEKPFVCKHCGRKLMSSSTLRKHLKVVHKEIQPFVSSKVTPVEEIPIIESHH